MTKHHTETCLQHMRALTDGEASVFAQECTCPDVEDEFRIDLDSRKYTLVFAFGRTCALRYGRPWRNLTGDNLIGFLGRELHARRQEALDQDRTTLGADGSVRKAHYGDDRQPWDDIVDHGWGPAFAAGCVTRYLRRDKRAEHSLQSARWYYRQLYHRAAQALDGPTAPWAEALHGLEDLLTQDELKLLRREP